MKFCYPEINRVFNTDIEKINTIVIENQKLLAGLLEDLYFQSCGNEGKAVLSEGDTPLSISKNLEVIDVFIPFELNRKSLVNKISGEMAKIAVSDEYFMETKELLSRIESYMIRLSLGLNCSLDFSKGSIEALIKSTGMELVDDYNNLGEKLIDYMEMINEFVGRKCFVFYNLRSIMSDEETELFMKTILSHGFICLLIENREYRMIECEQRFLVDKDLCEICF